MLTHSTGTILAIMRSLRVSLPLASIELSKRAWNLGLLMGSPLHLTQLPSHNLAIVGRARGPGIFGLVPGIKTHLGRNLHESFG